MEFRTRRWATEKEVRGIQPTRTGMAKLAGVEFRFYTQCRGRWEALTTQEMLPLLSPSAHAASGMTRGHWRESQCAGLDRSPLSERGDPSRGDHKTGGAGAGAVEPAAEGSDSCGARVPARLPTLRAEPPRAGGGRITARNRLSPGQRARV